MLMSRHPSLFQQALARSQAWDELALNPDLDATSSTSTKHVPTTSSPPPHSNSSSSSSSTPSPSSPNPSPPPNSSSSSSPSSPPPRSPIQSLMSSPTLFSPLLPPRHPIILSHGLYGFDVRGPSAFPRLQMHYWSNVLGVLRGRVGAEVIVAGVPGTGSIVKRAEEMHRFLREKAKGRNINFLAHSMGGLDCRHVITHIRPTEYHPISLTTVSTPHRGSPFMDWCLANIGIGTISSLPSSLSALPKSLTSFAVLPSSFTTLLLSLIDSPAYSNLTTSFLASFNERTPNVEGVKYFSVAARIQRAGKGKGGKGGMGIWHPLWFPKIILDASEERERELLLGGQKSPSTNSNSASEKRGMQSAGAGIGRETGNTGGRDGGREWGNDGLVTIESAKWGEFLGVLEGCDHWEMRGARGIGQDWDFFSSSGLGKYVGWSKNIGKDRAKAGEGRNTEGKAGRSEGKGNVNVEERGIVDNGVESKGEREEREREIKASTDSLSAVVDWIVDHMPASSSGSSSSSSLSSSLSDSPSSPSSKSSKSSTSATGRGEGGKERHDLATKFDLERFYVALCRKLYEEGL
ncbi:alpha/beta-hydrolase [Sistotremastrum niveocremeum HHB9708]|uniref:Alpha/beta-hydrolase n=1 Tax=Sistotremastrum niveocremeum HHB9708 TaxID=1314777 RepID=A0A164V3R9_9AGAM|nr:alpha/beta-hydrolase [Sistotremastrum niveocremeum HHB9708]